VERAGIVAVATFCVVTVFQTEEADWCAIAHAATNRNDVVSRRIIRNVTSKTRGIQEADDRPLLSQPLFEFQVSEYRAFSSYTLISGVAGCGFSLDEVTHGVRTAEERARLNGRSSAYPPVA
jgi:hypothetical protein